MIKKTFLLLVTVIGSAFLGLTACTTNATAAQAVTDNQSNKVAVVRTVDPTSLWEGKLMDDSRFKMGIVLTEKERQIAKKSTATLTKNLKTGEPFIHHMLSELAKRDMPAELIAIPLIESGMNPRAKSTSGAQGLWQYMRRTGKSLGLERSKNYDEFYDVIETTNTSLKYLDYLYNELEHNWDLVIAAFNQGEFGVKRAIASAKKAGVKEFNLETVQVANYARHYVRRFHAFAAMLQHPEEFGVTFPQIKNRPAFRRVEVAGRINSMKQAAELSGTSLEALQHLNAGYLSDKLESHANHGLLVPVEHVSRLEHALKEQQTAAIENK